MKIAAFQMVSSPDLDENLEHARRGVAEAASAGAELVALPEYFCQMGLRDADKLKIAETPGQGPIQQALADLARTHGVWIIGGTLPLQAPGHSDRAFNSCLAFGPDGQMAARYDKIHLFRFDDGERRYDEAQTLLPGQDPVTFDAPLRSGPTLRVGLSICYDLRFPELYRTMMNPPCDLIVVPAAFTHPTGEAHWELLLRTRAVENQCWVLASAQGGAHANGRRTWGHSMLIDPWGRIVSVLPEGEGVVLGDVDLEVTHRVRRQLPALEHRVLGR